jgi:hypothetical protein
MTGSAGPGFADKIPRQGNQQQHRRKRRRAHRENSDLRRTRQTAV